MKNKMSLFLVLMLATGISQAAGDLKIGFVNGAKVLEKAPGSYVKEKAKD